MLSAVDIGNQISHVTGATYNAPGALTGSTYGQTASFTGILNTFSFNSRLQPVNLWSSSPVRMLMNLVYDFHAVGNQKKRSSSRSLIAAQPKEPPGSRP